MFWKFGCSSVKNNSHKGLKSMLCNCRGVLFWLDL